ncbi:MAG: hypothetical protein VW518_00850 [Burkholderiaceae bacterium]
MAHFPKHEAGVNLTATYASAGAAPFTLGTTVELSEGGEAILVESSASALSTYSAVVISDTFIATMLTTGVARSGGNRVGFAQTSIGTGRVGWVFTKGKVVVNLQTNAAAFVPLYTHATAGNLDSVTVSGSGGCVMGLYATTSVSNATAATCVAVSRPYVHKAVGS